VRISSRTYERASWYAIQLGPMPSIIFLTSPESPKPSYFGPKNLEAAIAIDNTTNSASVFNCISKWLDVCSPKNHPRCHSHPLPSFVPRRLLDIRELGRIRIQDTDLLTSDGIRIREILINESSFRYATLSHCWGTKRPLVLDNDTAPELYAGFEESVLPQTFRDAVVVARKLSISYLWIDSLCINQDDQLDWLKQSQDMARVYSGSYCNIAATGAADSSEGLFFERKPSNMSPFLVRKGQETAERDPENQEDPLPHAYFVVPESYYVLQNREAPLFNRAWVVQERVLSRRSVHFGRLQVFWECSHMHACEFFPTRVPVEAQSLEYSKTEELIRGNPVVGLKYATHKDPWNGLVNLYTRCKLTYPKDRLPAIAGIASLYAGDEQHGDYLAGLWKKDFFRHLLWQGGTTLPRLQYGAPSWSWASIDGMVHYGGYGKFITGSTLSLLEVFSENDIPSTTVSNTFLNWRVRVEGPLHKANRLHQTPQSPFGTLEIQMEQLCLVSCSFKLDIDLKNTKFPECVYVMLIGIGTYPGENNSIISGLLLQPTNVSSGEFRRIGIAYIYIPKWLGHTFGEVYGSELLPQPHYESIRELIIEGDKRYLYTFSLV
jgi:Heterokaryon incompatibility protein (HET)